MTTDRRRHGSRRAFLREHPVLFGSLIAAVLAATTLLATVSTNGVPVLPSYELSVTLPPGAPAMRAGSEVRVSGLVMGVVSKSTPTARGQHVRFRLRGPAQPVGTDAHVTVRLRSPAGQHYLAVDRGHFSGHPLRSGAELPARQATRSEDLLDVVEGFRREALRDLSAATRFAGAGVAGRGTDLNRSLAGLGLTLTRTAGIVRAATPGDDLTGLLRESARTARGLAGDAPGDAGRATSGAARSFGAFADRSSAIAAFLRELRPAEDETRRTLPAADALLDDTTLLAGRMLPATRALRRALPSLTDVLGRGPVLRRESLRLARVGLPALRALAPVARRLAPSALMVGLAAAPTGPLSAYLSRYQRELEAGLSAFAGALTYLNAAGRAPNTPAAPAMLVFTCARGSDVDPQPGQLLSEHMGQRCQ